MSHNQSQTAHAADDSQGPDHQGPDNQGPDNQGLGNQGPDDQGSNDGALGLNAGPQGLGVGLMLDRIGDGFEADADKTFQFTTSGGTVTAIQVTDGSQTFGQDIPSNATFTLGAGTVTETLAGVHATTTIDYAAETSNPALYQVTSVTETINSPTTLTGDGGSRGFSFTVSGGAVTAEQFTSSEGSHTHSESVPIPSDAQFTVGAGTITETLAVGNTLETLTYVQPTGQTLYALASEQSTVIAQGTATTALDIEPQERDEFTISGGTVTAAERLNADGSATAITLGGHVSFSQIAPNMVEETSTFDGHTGFEVFATGSGGGGIYTAIAHGEGTAVDVAGLNTQLAELPSWVTTLI